ncbi:MAG: CDP-alcohol phosphatidyltransferase family protein [bacterium]
MRFAELGYISNLLSLSRVFLVIPLYFCLKLESESANYWAFFVMVLIAATDVFDGRLARKLKQQSDLGRILDPLADKVGVAITCVLLVKLRDLPLWYLIVILSRDIAILILALFWIAKTKVVVESRLIGKATVLAIGIVLIVFTLQLESVKWPFLWLSLMLVVISSIDYFWQFIRLYGDENS